MTGTVILPLSMWTQSNIKGLYHATTQSATNNILDNFLEKDAVITVNGKNISRSDLVKELQIEKFFEVGASITFHNIVEVPADKSAPAQVICFYFRSTFDLTDRRCYGCRLGRVSWNFLHRYHSTTNHCRRCACVL